MSKNQYQTITCRDGNLTDNQWAKRFIGRLIERNMAAIDEMCADAGMKPADADAVKAMVAQYARLMLTRRGYVLPLTTKPRKRREVEESF